MRFHLSSLRVLLLGALSLSCGMASAQNAFSYLEDEAEPGGYDVTAQVVKLPVEWSLAEQGNGDGYRLRMTASSVELSTLQNKKPVVLTSTKTSLAPGRVVLQRRGVRWQIVHNNRILLQAEDDNWQDGKIGWRGGEVKDARLQPVEEIAFDDNFMRVEKEVALKEARVNPTTGVRIKDVKTDETLWRTLAGAWTTTGISENESAMVAQSANPFAFQAKNAGENLATAGYAFWSDYSMEIAVKPQIAQSVGIALYAQDASSYILFQWHANGKIQLRQIIAGASKTLAESQGQPYDDKNWYRLSFEVSGKSLRASIDGEEILRARTDAFGRGLVGVYANHGTAGNTATRGTVFDDLRVRSVMNFQDDFSSPVAGRWQTISGAWKFSQAAKPDGDKGAFAVMGESEWSDYSASAEIALPDDGAAGLVAHHLKGEGAYVFRIAGSKAKLSYAGKAQLIKIGGGKSLPLAEVAVGSRFDGTNARWRFSIERGYLQGLVEIKGKPIRILDAVDTSLTQGRAGLYAQKVGKGVPQLQNFSVEFPREKKVWADVPEIYMTGPQPDTMGEWSTPDGLFIPQMPIGVSMNTPATGGATRPNTKSTNDKTFWHKGTFWGDSDIRVKLPEMKAGQNLILLFGAMPSIGSSSSKTSTPPLKLTLSYDGANLKATLSRGDQKLGEGSNKIAATKDTPLEFSRRGRFVLVRSGPQDEQSTLLTAKVG